MLPGDLVRCNPQHLTGLLGTADDPTRGETGGFVYIIEHLKTNGLIDITAEKNADGSVAVQFGGCDGKISNCLPTMAGWNYMVRFYRPRAEVLSGKWKFPEAQRVN